MRKSVLDGIVNDILSLTPMIRRSIQRKLVRTAFSLIEEDITLPHLEIMKTLHVLGTAHNAEIGEKLQIPKPQMTHLIDRLEKLGIIVRQPDNSDRRIVNVSLTDKGQRIIDEIDEVIKTHIAGKLECLTDEELHELSASLRKLGDILQKF